MIIFFFVQICRLFAAPPGFDEYYERDVGENSAVVSHWSDQRLEYARVLARLNSMVKAKVARNRVGKQDDDTRVRRQNLPEKPAGNETETGEENEFGRFGNGGKNKPVRNFIVEQLSSSQNVVPYGQYDTSQYRPRPSAQNSGYSGGLSPVYTVPIESVQGYYSNTYSNSMSYSYDPKYQGEGDSSVQCWTCHVATTVDDNMDLYQYCNQVGSLEYCKHGQNYCQTEERKRNGYIYQLKTGCKQPNACMVNWSNNFSNATQ